MFTGVYKVAVPTENTKQRHLVEFIASRPLFVLVLGRFAKLNQMFIRRLTSLRNGVSALAALSTTRHNGGLNLSTEQENA